jgi:hypothetical protein
MGNIEKALDNLKHFFFEHSAIYSKRLMSLLEKETSVEWFMWSLRSIKPTQFNPNHKIKYWIRRLFTLQFKTVVQTDDLSDGLGYCFIKPFGKKYKAIKANENRFIELIKQEYPKED